MSFASRLRYPSLLTDRLPRGRRHRRLARPGLELLEDRTLPATFTVINTLDSGVGSLRWAIEEANSTPGHDDIEFDIPGSGPHTIQPLTALPAISDAVTINGYTQSGASRNTLPVGNNAVLQIELDGSLAGSGSHGLFISGGNTTLRGLVINRFDGHPIWMETSGNNIIEGCFVLVDAAGTSPGQSHLNPQQNLREAATGLFHPSPR
jgi:hypothetical protein